jgi:hypothetical protein
MLYCFLYLSIDRYKFGMTKQHMENEELESVIAFKEFGIQRRLQKIRKKCEQASISDQYYSSLEVVPSVVSSRLC